MFCKYNSIKRFNFYQYKMMQYNSFNAKLSNSQLNKLKSAIKNKTGIVLRLSLSMVGDDEPYFPYKLLLTNRQVTNLRKAFANKSSTDIKLSKTHLTKMVQSRGCLDRLLGPLLKTGLPLIENVIKPLVKSVLIPLGSTATASAADAGIHTKIGSGKPTTLITSNDEIKDIIEIVKSLEDSGLLLKESAKQFKVKLKNKKVDFLVCYLVHWVQVYYKKTKS